ncbi:MAG TPA: penicillin-binding protein activator [Xanthobacteraceae bacterium]|nr:penicillin-binding protein activator [Xanthobacteraceae bacterium]
MGIALGGCSTVLGPIGSGPIDTAPAEPAAANPATADLPLGPGMATGPARVALILPLGAGGNAGAAAQSMKNAAELALAEFSGPNVQLIVKDDGGTSQGAQAAARAAIQEGAEIVLGPLFSGSVAAAGQVTKARGIPMIAFSTDTNVAAPGVYLLSFLPESDVERIVRYAVANGKRSLVALLPDNAYGAVVEAQLQQAVSQTGARIMTLEHYATDQTKFAEPVKRVALASKQADAVFIADSSDTTSLIVQMLEKNGVQRMQLIGTGLWDDPKLFADPKLAGAWFAAPDSAAYRAFSDRYKARYGQEPTRTASLTYDAVSLVAALVKTQGPNRFTEATLTNPSGFTGIDGVFRFRTDGTCERGLAVMEMRGGTARVISPAPRVFSSAAL